ncbi:Potassium voltage-gated channel subfamily A member 2 [Schistosoma japonicum]|uniref:Potassium voltage-gated channel subfamily A member 2 n=1 Tax=Schistosoma japonicum TaxID=6182 RepID=A0A4Z2DTK0_SCHJA|nr:Potassium voltage-gated channel subfamily A member 2 [Schistosoma japonicum]
MRECIFHNFMAEYFFSQLNIFYFITLTLELKDNSIVIVHPLILIVKMLYTTSLMKVIPQTPKRIESDKFMFSSTPEISHATNRSRDFFGLIKKRTANEKSVCSRHPLYHHAPHCRHQHDYQRYYNNRRQECSYFCVNHKPSTSKSKSTSRHLISKQLSLPVEYMDEEKSCYSSSGIMRTTSILGNDVESGLANSDDDLRSCVNIHVSDMPTDKQKSNQSPDSPSSTNSYLRSQNVHQTALFDTKAVFEVNNYSEAQCSYSSITSNKSKLKYIDDTDASNLCDDVHKDSFKDRLSYFPKINSRLIIENSSRHLFHSISNSSHEMGKYNSTGVIDIKSSMPKKELKFAIPEFLMPIIDRRTSSQLVNMTKIPESTMNVECKLMKRRKTIKERFKQLHSDYDGSKFWNKLNKNNKMNEMKNLSTTRSRPSMIISMDYTHQHHRHNDSISRSSITSCDDCRRVIINVSGLKFETWLTVLESHPNTLLGDYNKRKPFYDEYRNEYFFDRHRPSFEAIFNYYQYGGRLKRPAIVSDDVFLTELEFFQIESEALDIYKKNEGYVPDVIILPENVIKRKLWMLFEYPETSVLAFTFSMASFIFTVISIILFCIETLPVYAQTHCEPGAKPNFRDPFFIIETLCTFWFTVEIFIRFISCPSQKIFIKDIKNLIDLAAIVPYYITLFNVLITFSCEGAKNSASLAFLRVIRLIRVFKLTKHSSGLQVLVLTFKESIEGLSLFLVAFIVCILVFSSTIYYVEIDRKGSQIESIPDAFWWAVITMCTVGYGDKVPKGPLGKVVGSVCAVAGVLTLAIPVPIITENFNKFYAHKTGRGRR